jgi:uncharacterized protein YdeI (YjbR/CyaY-like superfamily)
MKTTKGTPVPPALAGALKAHADAREIYERMSPSCQREYGKWVGEAKKAETQARRAESAVKQIIEQGGRRPARKK